MKEVNKMQRFETQLYQINLKQRDTATFPPNDHPDGHLDHSRATSRTPTTTNVNML